MAEGNKIPTTRRRVLKAIVGLPVLGAFTIASIRNVRYNAQRAVDIAGELGLNNLSIQNTYGVGGENNELLRIGIIGFGSRAIALANGLGYIHPDDAERRGEGAWMDNWNAQKDLNVAITGICEVFDLRAKSGLETFSNPLHPGGARHHELPVKRYLDYREMLEDKEIDAVVIATPDHWHAKMTIEAIQAGKHVYCEKCISRTEEELYNVYDVVNKSDYVYQLGHQIAKNRVFQQAREIIKRGVLGNISMVETTTNRNTARGAWIRHKDSDGNLLPGNTDTIDWKQWLGPAPEVPFSKDRYYNWTKWFDYGTGILGQLFSHEFDAFNQLLEIGIPESVMASGGTYYWKDGRDIPDLIQAVFQYPDHGLTLTYSGNLVNSFHRSRKIMGRDATMELGGTLQITADGNSDRYKKLIEKGAISTDSPMITMDPFQSDVDAVSSATEAYYASRGLTYTFIDGKKLDVTHLHIAEWVDCIRNGGVPSGNIDKSFDEGVAIQMAQKSYKEKREVYWDADKRRIV